MFQGTKSLEILPEVGDRLRALADTDDQREAWENYSYDNSRVNENDRKAVLVEMIARLIKNELGAQGIVKNTDSDFLNDYVPAIMEKAADAELRFRKKIKENKAKIE